MKKTTLALLIALCLFPLTLESYKISVEASPTIWIVDDDGPANFTSIQEAINAANPGDTIFVHNGTYYENLVINKSITLVGENRDFTIINGNETGNVIEITFDKVSISGFAIQKSELSGSGIFIGIASSIMIYHNKIINNYEGISIHYSINITISNNIISNNFNGIYARSVTHSLFSDNIISLNTFGICLFSSSENVISRNVISDNSVNGISFDYSGANEVCYNTIYDNYKGITLVSSEENTIYCNNFNNFYQVLSDSPNTWTYESEGNHWSDYTGQDLNGDGIGDSSYKIDARNQDSFPLVGTAFNFPVYSEGKTYGVTIITNSTVMGFRFEIGGETGNKIIRFNVSDDEEFFSFSRVTIPTGLMRYPYIVLIDNVEASPTYLNVSGSYVRLYLTHSSQAQVSIISSGALSLYYELLAKQISLNQAYATLLDDYSALLENYSRLQESFDDLNASYQQLLSNYSMQSQIIQNLVYVVVFSAAVFIVVTVYLSRHAHARAAPRLKVIEDEG